ncbi:MAG: hypothetical protein J6V14_11275, partial [Clostridia bacterium]|nr:hypothetical protein [Clostridia bacterium]
SVIDSIKFGIISIKLLWIQFIFTMRALKNEQKQRKTGIKSRLLRTSIPNMAQKARLGPLE